jgi:formylglycine-generating enzyme required for sulfatase activity
MNDSFTGMMVEENSTLTTSQYQVTTVLSDNTAYYWRVKVQNVDGVWGDWGNAWNFTVDITPPTTPSPATGSTTYDPLLNWEDVTGAAGYHVQVATNSSFTSPLEVDNSTLAASHYQVTATLTRGTTYYWHVKTKNDDGFWSDWSNTWSFSVLLRTTKSQTSETTGSVTFYLRFVEAGDYYVGDQTGSYDYAGNTNVTLSKGYWIAETEVTYELWYEVRTWGEGNGYTFANLGAEGGHGGTIGEAPTDDSQEPVTSINWRDTMIWCNALSEKQGLTPVYYTDSGYTTPIRAATNNSLDTTAGHEDNPWVSWNAEGYRLPTEVEWEIAARGADLSSGYGTVFAGNDAPGDVAWYQANSGLSTHDVGTKWANELGLYDMSGNVCEWSWDWWGSTYPTASPDPKGSTTGASRALRGGSYYGGAGEVFFRYSDHPDYHPAREHPIIGFRPVGTAE